MSVTMNGISTTGANRPRIECVITSPYASPATTILVPVTATWTVNNYARAGTFSAGFAYELSQGAPTAWYDPPDPSAGSAVKVDFQIWPSYLADGQDPHATRGTNASPQFQGLVDKVSFDPATGTLQVSGRDYSVLLLDYAVDDAFLNSPASEIVQKLAAAVGLQSSVTPTQGPSGRFFAISHTRHTTSKQSRFKNAWDLLSKLASYEQYDLWVDGTTLNFHPALSNTTIVNASIQMPGQGGHPYAVANFESVLLDRDLIIAKGVKVEISSWDSAQRAAHVGTWPRSPAANAVVYSPTIAPNLSNAQVQALAITIYNDILAHLRTVTIAVPGDLTMQPRQSLQLMGTGTSWDRLYRIDNIEREMSFESGFKQTVVARTRDAAGDAS